MKCLVVALFTLTAPFLFSSPEIGVIRNPIPNMTEKEFVELVLVRETQEKLTEDEYIFSVFSLAAEPKSDRIFVYDDLQAKILVLGPDLNFIKSYRSVGEGPGGFKGERFPVFIDFGLDGLLYANDHLGRKFLAFDKNLEFIREFRMQGSRMAFFKPVVDEKGAPIFIDIENNTVLGKNLKNETIFKIPVTGEDLSTLFYRKKKDWLNSIESIYTPSGTLLIYLSNSSTMLLVKDNRLLKKMVLRPKEALEGYKSQFKKVLGYKHPAFTPMFGYLKIDKTDSSSFYLNHGLLISRNIAAIYKFSLDGELSKVYYQKQDPKYAIKLIQNGIFYGRDREKEKIVELKPKKERKNK